MISNAVQAIMILGPTASGKTAVSLELVEKFPCEIISIDSALVYRKMDIGTAKPTKEERARCPHHLIDIIEPTESYSAANFVADAEKLIGQIRSRGKIPLIVGGTMLYAKALREGLSELPSTIPEVREELLSRIEEEGLESLYEELKQVDPETAKRLFPGDTQRITRALEVFQISGKPISSFYGLTKATDYSVTTIALLPPDRAELHKKIEVRFDQMLQAGFLEEVQSLRQIEGLTKNHTSMRCVGYRQAWDYLDGLTDYEGFRMAAIAATRQLAKRQMTWLRSMQSIQTFDPADPKLKEELSELCRKAG